MNNSTVKRKKQFVPNVVKFFIAIGSMLGTLGIWNMLANKDLLQVNGQGTIDDQSLSNFTQAPLPTLVPLLNIETTSSGIIAVQPATELQLREVSQPFPSVSVNSPSNANPVIIPAPVTTTRSSRP
jgi:hypothetical protein